MSTIRKPVIAITLGDYNGIGPEVVLKCLNKRATRALCNPLVIGPPQVLEYYAERLGISFALRPAASSGKGIPYVSSSEVSSEGIRPGKLSKEAGLAAGLAITFAVRLALEGKVDAVVTAPVSKRALHLAGFSYPGQTEMVQRLSNSPSSAMMLVSKTLRVGLVTIHVPLARVPGLITQNLVKEKITIIANALVRDWRIKKPRLAVLALNPHAGENGDIGSEEKRVIEPALRDLIKKGMRVAGPYPADAFFAQYSPNAYDAVVAMYHDQGLIPLKMSSFGKGVNITAGLRIVRTSPDHGTAFDIAGRGIADPGSMQEAIALAATVAKNRKRNREGLR